MKTLTSFVYAVLAGAAIGIGGVAFLSCESTLVGAIFFCVGLFTVCTFGLNLYTGKVCYLFENPPSYLGFLLLVWVGNLAGAALVGYAVRATRIAAIADRARQLCQTKLGDDLWSIFLLAVFCNVLIFIAVDGFKNNAHELGKYLGLIFGVTVFILCGFEHCVANMFYFSVANAWGGKTVLYLLVMTLGNSCGGVIVPLCRKLKARAEKAAG